MRPLHAHIPCLLEAAECQWHRSRICKRCCILVSGTLRVLHLLHSKLDCSEQGQTAEVRGFPGEVYKQYGHGGGRCCSSFTSRRRRSLRQNIPCGLSWSGLPHLHVGCQNPRAACASAYNQVSETPSSATMTLARSHPHVILACRLHKRNRQQQACIPTLLSCFQSEVGI